VRVALDTNILAYAEGVNGAPMRKAALELLQRTLTLVQCHRTLTFGNGDHDTMLIRTPTDLGALIRDRRIKLGMDQKSLAQKVGVSRQWIVAAEQGKPRAEIGLLLRTIEVLGIRLSTDKESQANTKNTDRTPPVDIDSIIATARRKRK
jgi:HTH-type transcriptional regulator/antitoxin HipB